MTIEEIIELWKSVGWNNLTDYHEFLRSGDRIILDELHPNKINPKTFWLAADQHFGTDPVCNHNNDPFKRLPIIEANNQNYRLSVYTGMAGQTLGISAMLNAAFGRVDIAEIGCGYCCLNSLYHEIENKYWTKTSYTGFDIIKRAKDVVEIEGEDGTFSDKQICEYTEKFNLFYSANVFQHLSREQIESYLRAVYNMLPYGGYFNMMYATNCSETYHYGQVIDIIPIESLEHSIKCIGYEIVGFTNLKIPNSVTPYIFVLKK